MLNAIPIIGWLLSLLFTASLSLPFWICWTKCGIGAKYFYFLPEVYHSIGFWSCVGLFLVIGMLKSVLVPSLASVTQNAGGNN